MKRIIFTMLMSGFMQPLVALERIDSDFSGKWCGKWDGIYPVCITIDSIKENSSVGYEWVEKEGEGFKQSVKKLSRINRNTLKIDNIFFVIDENKLDSASVMGVFEIQTRMALLQK